MPTITGTPEAPPLAPVQGFAHCVSLRGKCPGYAQEPVDAYRQTMAVTYGEQGAGEGPIRNMTERSFHTIVFANDDDKKCVHCGFDRMVTDQLRKDHAEYVPGADAEVLAKVAADTRVADLEAQVAKLVAANEAKGAGVTP